MGKVFTPKTERNSTLVFFKVEVKQRYFVNVLINVCYTSGRLHSLLLFWSFLLHWTKQKNKQTNKLHKHFFQAFIASQYLFRRTIKYKRKEKTNLTNIYSHAFVATRYLFRRNTNCLALRFCFEKISQMKMRMKIMMK